MKNTQEKGSRGLPLAGGRGRSPRELDLLNGLNPSQQQAVITTEGPLLILAGAGSGKTRALIFRMAYLVELGVNPFNILAITFTNKAAREMKERAEKLVTGGAGIWVSTFHSMCVRILRREIEKIGFSPLFTIYDTADSERLMKEVLKEENISDKQFPAKTILSKIGRQKDELVTPEIFEVMAAADFREQITARLYKRYQERLKAANALDFDDIIVKTIELFSLRPDVLGRYQERFRYVMVDEYQDTNTAQYQLIRFLSSRYENLCVVGDDDQSIYGWRGANIRNILDFKKDFPDAVVVRLEQNYRSTQTILNAANAVIDNNGARMGKNLWTENVKGDSLQYFRADDETSEAMYIADAVLREVKLGANFRDFAVLYRANAQSRAIEEVLFKNALPYRIYGGIRFYERKEIKDALAYLNAIVNSDDDLSIKRIINVPKRGIGDTTIAKLEAFARDNDISFFDACSQGEAALGKTARTVKVAEFARLINDLKPRSKADNFSLSDFVGEVMEESGMLDELRAQKDEESDDVDRVKNVMELVNKAAEFENNPSDDKSLAAFLGEVKLVADIDGYNEADDFMALMTMHSAKGLEFKQVFIVGFEETVFPGWRAVTSGELKDVEEERRLCYVAITRAMEKLYLTNAVSRRLNGNYVSNPPSRFLKEVPKELISGGAQKRAQGLKPRTISQSEAEGKPSFMTQRSFLPPPVPVTSKERLDFAVGDKVTQSKYGEGEVLEIRAAGADYEVTVEFFGVGRKKFMAHLSKLQKV